ncbi:MAG: DNA repair protein RecN, partial [Balneolaceae bacterium]
MIKSLYIKNFALIDELDVEFKKGLNILTGQTGAGKSIIIGALNMILGERADTEVLRQGSKKAIAEARIQVDERPEIKKILQDNAVEFSRELILRREITNSGSRGFINDTPVTIGILKAAGNYLVDLHGQHDHQFLLNDENHRKVMDDFETVKPLLEAYRSAYRDMADLQKDLKLLKRREADIREKAELHQFQASELAEARLDAEEEEKLTAEMTLLDNAEELDQKAALITGLGSDNDASLLNLLNIVRLHLEEIARIEPEFASYLEEVKTAGISIQETVRFTERYRSGIEFNPARLEELRQRQAELRRLKKKYNRSVPELISYLEELRSELSLAENFDVEIEKLENRISGQSDILRDHALALHEKRQEEGEELAGDIEEKLKHLGISTPCFRVNVNWQYAGNGWFSLEGRPVECHMDGCDEVLFFISTNKGEDPKPLSRIASGGEVSRVMLALKSIIAREQQLPVMIFDEIDTGISGHISEKVGVAMRRLSSRCQIIAITHQPQIASQAHKHYRVEKVET